MKEQSNFHFETIRRPLRRWLRRAFRSYSSPFIRNLVSRVPNSRFSKMAQWLFGGKEIITYRGVNIEVNPGDILGYYAYFLDDYEGPIIDKLIELCKNNQVFVDIGANYGWLSLSVGQARPALSVFAFEPDRRIISKFRENLGRNQHLSERIQLIEKAVGDFNGETLFIPSNLQKNPGTGRLGNDGYHDLDSREVAIIRLDSFFQDGMRPDVVKIDVEGAELKVLRGMQGLFELGLPRSILIETHAFYHGVNGAEFNSEIVRRLEEAGFSLTRLSHSSWVPLTDASELGNRCHLLALR